MLSALIDTSCGFAAATATGGEVVASHSAISFLATAAGEAFVARAKVLKAGWRQVFAEAEKRTEDAGPATLIATGEAILVPTARRSEGSACP